MAVEFDAWELSQLRQKVNADLLCYLGHSASGGLKAGEVEHMEKLRRLADKLDGVVAA